MLLGRVDVSPDENFVIFTRLKLLVDEPLVVEAVAQDEGVWYRPLQELGRDVRQIRFIGNLENQIFEKMLFII